MWSDSKLVLFRLAQAAANSMADISLTEDQWATFFDGFPGSQVTDWVRTTVKELLLRRPSSLHLTVDLQSSFERQVITFVRQITTTNQYNLFHHLWNICGEGAFEFPQPEAQIMRSILGAVYLLLGSERKVLLGVRHNQPAFMTLAEPLDPHDEGRFWSMLSKLLNQNRWAYVGQEDIDIMPDPELWHNLLDVYESKEWPNISWDTVQDLLEDSYYRQRYTVNPAGAYVRLNYHGIKALTLKVKPGLRGFSDPNFVDLLATIDLDDGQTFEILDGARGTGQKQRRHTLPGAVFFQWLIAQVYHDLVTAEEIEVEGQLAAKAQSSSLKQQPSTNHPGWVYIPRVIKGRQQYPRRPLAEPRVSEPYHVRGFPRRGSMTERHRLELLEFQKLYGIDVFAVVRRREAEIGVPCTYVRPHIVPAASPAEIQRLPRFIRARMQAALEAAVSSDL